MKRFSLTTLLFFATLSLPFFSSAQSLQMLGDDSAEVNVTTKPSVPGPNQFVTATIESFAMDLDRATISWYSNGKLAQEAVGKKTFTFKTGSPGSLSNILVLIQIEGKPPVQKTLNIRPATVDLVAEAQSYTPPFYKGKALYSYQGTVKVVALPNFVTENGGTINPKTLIYNWRVDNNPATNASGYGKSYILFNGGIPLKPAVVSVEVTSMDQIYSAEGRITLTPTQPGIVLYEDTPLMGTLYSRALSRSITLQDEEIKLVAVPYFIGTVGQEATGVKYTWRLDGKAVPAGEGKNSLSFRQEKGATGSANVSIQISNPAKIFQYAEANMNLSFGNNTATGF